MQVSERPDEDADHAESTEGLRLHLDLGPVQATDNQVEGCMHPMVTRSQACSLKPKALMVSKYPPPSCTSKLDTEPGNEKEVQYERWEIGPGD